MSVTNDQIRKEIVSFVERYDEHELRFVISYCIGYYGAITPQIWDVIRDLIREDMIID